MLAGQIEEIVQILPGERFTECASKAATIAAADCRPSRSDQQERFHRAELEELPPVRGSLTTCSPSSPIGLSIRSVGGLAESATHPHRPHRFDRLRRETLVRLNTQLRIDRAED